ncbi:hypothetical protein CON22_17485 [Bacillus cereus]|nr:hypothetical protein CON22_17485 [Bacillus cereus]
MGNGVTTIFSKATKEIAREGYYSIGKQIGNALSTIFSKPTKEIHYASSTLLVQGVSPILFTHKRIRNYA